MGVVNAPWTWDVVSSRRNPCLLFRITKTAQCACEAAKQGGVEGSRYPILWENNSGFGTYVWCCEWFRLSSTTNETARYHTIRNPFPLPKAGVLIVCKAIVHVVSVVRKRLFICLGRPFCFPCSSPNRCQHHGLPNGTEQTIRAHTVDRACCDAVRSHENRGMNVPKLRLSDFCVRRSASQKTRTTEASGSASRLVHSAHLLHAARCDVCIYSPTRVPHRSQE